MTSDKRNPDIIIRLPDDKKILKAKIKKIAKRNRLTLTDMFIYLMTWFLEEYESGKQFSIKIE